MIRRSSSAALLAAGLVAAAALAADPGKDSTANAVQYLPLDAAGMSRAVIVDGAPLVYTRQLLPMDAQGKLVGEGSDEKQIDQVLANLETVLRASGSGLDKLVRVNIYALSKPAVSLFREKLAKRLGPDVRPAISAILTAFTQRKVLVAVDAVAASSEKGTAVALKRCDGVAGTKDCADAAVLPQGGVAYLSGQPEKGELAPATKTSLSTLLDVLKQLKLAPADVVQLKVFLTPAISADEALAEIKKLFPGQLLPPVVFVEWIASAPVEIELLARLPVEGKAAEAVEFYNPPGVEPSPSFSRVALVRSARQVFISGISAVEAGDGKAQAEDVFEQLKAIVAETGGDVGHLAKATYYVSDDEASDGLTKVRAEFLDPKRPPAASKVTIHGVGQPERTMAIDVIAVGKGG